MRTWWVACVLLSGCLHEGLEEKTECRYGGDCVTGLLCHQGMCMSREDAEALGFGKPPDMAQDLPSMSSFQTTIESTQTPTLAARDVLFTLRMDQMPAPIPLDNLQITANAPGLDTWALNFGLVEDADEDGALSQGDALEVREPGVNLIDPDTSRTYTIDLRERASPDAQRTQQRHSFVWSF